MRLSSSPYRRRLLVLPLAPSSKAAAARQKVVIAGWRFFLLFLLLSVATIPNSCYAFQNFLGRGGSSALLQIPSLNKNSQKLEKDLLDAIANSNRLGADDKDTERTISDLIQQLENVPSIPQPAIAKEIYGSWKLLYTSNANTSSPIQRKAVSSSQFPIYQDIVVNGANNNQLLVKQIVQFTSTRKLSVDAIASNADYPIPELSERKTTGKVLGMNVLGVSMTGSEAEPDVNKPNSRIDFVFDEGYLDWSDNGPRIPYPVPFRLPILRDWVKGWIDITYLSETVRISRGNKGTTFVLVKQ